MLVKHLTTSVCTFSVTWQRNAKLTIRPFNHAVVPAIEQLKETPALIERTIIKLEKKSESLEKDNDNDNDMSSLAKELWKKIIW